MSISGSDLETNGKVIRLCGEVHQNFIDTTLHRLAESTSKSATEYCTRRMDVLTSSVDPY